MLQRHAKEHGYDLDIFYTNIEGEAINRIYRAVDESCDGLVMNPAGFTYAGFALKDCIKGAALPYVEVHISNIAKRNIHCVLSDASEGFITGFGMHSYMVSTRCSRFYGRGARKRKRDEALAVPMKVSRAESSIFLVDPTLSLRGAQRRSNPWPVQTAGLLRCARNDDVGLT
jgi:3-dehydroquinate dehydratase